MPGGRGYSWSRSVMPAPVPESMPFVLWVYMFWGVLMGAPLATVGVVVCFVTEQQIAVIATLPSDGGPAAFVGPIDRPKGTRLSPMGVEVVGWSGIVRATTRRGKSSSSTVLCQLGALDDLTLGGRALGLEAETTVSDDALELASGYRGRARANVVSGDVTTTESLPSEVLARCPMKPTEANEKRVWIEHRFVAGRTVTFIGCREGDRLRRCEADVPGNGALIRGDRRELVGRTLAATLGMTTAVMAISLFFAVVSVFFTIAQLRAHSMRARS